MSSSTATPTVTPPATPPATPAATPSATPSATPPATPPARLIRIGAMVRELLAEVRGAALDEASRRRVRDVQAAALGELRAVLPVELFAEFDRIARPLAEDTVPTVPELRAAQAQLVGWLEGIFHGVQFTLAVEQAGAAAQLAELARQDATSAAGRRSG